MQRMRSLLPFHVQVLHPELTHQFLERRIAVGLIYDPMHLGFHFFDLVHESPRFRVSGYGPRMKQSWATLADAHSVHACGAAMSTVLTAGPSVFSSGRADTRHQRFGARASACWTVDVSCSSVCAPRKR